MAVVMALNESDIDKIIADVGNEHVPLTLVKSELVRDINDAWNFYENFKRDNAKGANTKRSEYAKSVACKAHELFDLLNSSDPNEEYARIFIGKWISLDALTQTILKLERTAGKAQRKFGEGSSLRAVLGLTPSFWFLGHSLVGVFEKHFRIKATRTRLDGQPSGPYIRFATAVTATFGEPFVDETITKAISEVRKWAKENEINKKADYW
jgi:hypothetical protein